MKDEDLSKPSSVAPIDDSHAGQALQGLVNKYLRKKVVLKNRG